MTELSEQFDMYFANLKVPAEGLNYVEENDDADKVCKKVPNQKEIEYLKTRVDNIVEHVDEIDGIIEEVAAGWKLSRMGKIDLTILRLATYEICFDDDIPTGVAINEAVELAKKFGEEHSASFINGVLAKIANL